jgi:hypothetical protein
VRDLRAGFVPSFTQFMERDFLISKQKPYRSPLDLVGRLFKFTYFFDSLLSPICYMCVQIFIVCGKIGFILNN